MLERLARSLASGLSANASLDAVLEQLLAGLVPEGSVDDVAILAMRRIAQHAGEPSGDPVKKAVAGSSPAPDPFAASRSEPSGVRVGG